MSQAAFWDRVARKYAASPIRDHEGYVRTRERTRGHLTAGDAVLELGCGTGTTALELAPSVAQITGTDVSPEMIRIATEKAAAQGVDNARFDVADADAPIANPGAWDAVLAHNLLHLVPSPERLVRHAHEALRPGGVLVSKTPCLGAPGLGWVIRLVLILLPVARALGRAPSLCKLSREDIERMHRQAGFEIVEAELSTGKLPRLYLVARKTQGQYVSP